MASNSYVRVKNITWLRSVPVSSGVFLARKPLEVGRSYQVGGVDVYIRYGTRSIAMPWNTALKLCYEENVAAGAALDANIPTGYQHP